MSSGGYTAKISGQLNYQFTMFKLVVVLVFVFMSTTQFVYLTLAILLGGSIILFQRVHLN